MMTSKLNVCILYFVHIFIGQSLSQDPCNTYTALDEWKRSVAYSGDSLICDSFLTKGWYRITSGAGQNMPNKCVLGGFRCGTGYSIWMNGSYPDVGKTNNVTACASHFNGDCCFTSYDIQVKNCSGGYYVYNLVPTTGCPQGYCFGSELPCPAGETSPTGFTPGCKYEPCLSDNYKELTEWQRSVNNIHHTSTGSLCDSFLSPGWYRPTSLAGDIMPTSCMKNGFRCGTAYPIWMNGTYPPGFETYNVTACSSHFNGDCCWKSYGIQVRNCSKFLIYNLRTTTSCPEAYCFGTEIPCKEGEISSNGFTPGCEVDPCHSNNHRLISGEIKRSSNYTLLPDDDPIDDSNLSEGFYRFISSSGSDMVNTTQPMFQCGTKFPIYMNGSLPNLSEKLVTRKLCLSGHNHICQNVTNVQIQNCGQYRVYYLKPTPLKNSSYCIGTLPVKSNSEVTHDGNKNKVEDHLPWIVSVAVLACICVVLIFTIVAKKFFFLKRITPPPPYSPPINHALQLKMPKGHSNLCNSKK